MRLILIFGLALILTIPLASAQSFDNIEIQIPENITGGASHNINISFDNTGSVQVPYFVNISITSLGDTPEVWLNDFAISGCNESSGGHFMCLRIASTGHNSYQLGLTTKPNIYPGKYQISMSLMLISEEAGEVFRYIHIRHTHAWENKTALDESELSLNETREELDRLYAEYINLLNKSRELNTTNMELVGQMDDILVRILELERDITTLENAKAMRDALLAVMLGIIVAIIICIFFYKRMLRRREKAINS